tara:strand:- start:39 stop:356 length:318 start_codon:yes stop_codon:yes gene_type:complete
MTFRYLNVSATTDEQVLSAATSDGKTKKVFRLLICNTDTTAITVNLYLKNNGDTYYILKSVEIEAGYTLDVFEGEPFVYDDAFKLAFTLGHTDYVADIIMNEIRN